MDKLFELNKKLYSAHTGIGFGVIASSKQTVVLPVGGWVELGRATLGSTASTITVGSLADELYLQILFYNPGTGANGFVRAGNSTIDTSSNYSYRTSRNGAADSLAATQTTGMRVNDNAGSSPNFSVIHLANLSAKEKLLLVHTIEQMTAGAANAPNRLVGVGKHAFTSNPIDILQMNQASMPSGTQIIINGWDPSDVHTSNFWEEIASVTGSGSTSFDSGTFTAKKYLWVQYWYEGTSNVKSQVNSDTGTNYSTRRSTDGGADFTEVSQVGYTTAFGFAATGHFVNIFIVNNSATEKLAISNTVAGSTLGAGTAPSRQERVWKWDNISSQITSIQLTANSGTFASGAEMRIWGSN